MQVMALGLLRGVQDTRVPMWMAGLSYWLIGIPASYLLAFVLGYGGVGLWFGLVLGLASAGGMMMMAGEQIETAAATAFGAGLG